MKPDRRFHLETLRRFALISHCVISRLDLVRGIPSRSISNFIMTFASTPKDLDALRGSMVHAPKKSEERLKSSVQSLHHLLNNAPASIVFKNTWILILLSGSMVSGTVIRF